MVRIAGYAALVSVLALGAIGVTTKSCNYAMRNWGNRPEATAQVDPELKQKDAALNYLVDAAIGKINGENVIYASGLKPGPMPVDDRDLPYLQKDAQQRAANASAVNAHNPIDTSCFYDFGIEDIVKNDRFARALKLDQEFDLAARQPKVASSPKKSLKIVKTAAKAAPETTAKEVPAAQNPYTATMGCQDDAAARRYIGEPAVERTPFDAERDQLQAQNTSLDARFNAEVRNPKGKVKKGLVKKHSAHIYVINDERRTAVTSLEFALTDMRALDKCFTDNLHAKAVDYAPAQWLRADIAATEALLTDYRNDLELGGDLFKSTKKGKMVIAKKEFKELRKYKGTPEAVATRTPIDAPAPVMASAVPPAATSESAQPMLSFPREINPDYQRTVAAATAQVPCPPEQATKAERKAAKKAEKAAHREAAKAGTIYLPTATVPYTSPNAPIDEIAANVFVGPNLKNVRPLNSFPKDENGVYQLFAADKRGFIVAGEDNDPKTTVDYNLTMNYAGNKKAEVQFGEKGKEQHNPKKAIHNIDNRMDAVRADGDKDSGRIDFRFDRFPGEKVVDGWRRATYDPDIGELRTSNGSLIAKIRTFRGIHPIQIAARIVGDYLVGSAIGGGGGGSVGPGIPHDGSGSPML